MLEFLRTLIALIAEMTNELNGAETVLDRIKEKMESTLATAQAFDDLLKKFDDETTRLSGILVELFGKLAAGGMSAAEENAELAKGVAIAERLAKLGSDPTAPIPPIVP